MRYLIGIFLLSLLATQTATAQRQRIKINVDAYHVSIGGAKGNYGKHLNPALEQLNNGSLDGNMAYVGARYAHFQNRFMWGIDGNFTGKVASRGFNNSNNFFAYNQFFNGVLKVGYSPVVWDNIYFVYPTLGIGGGYGRLRRVDMDANETKAYGTWGTSAEAALNFTIITPIPGDRDTKVVLDLSGGYLYGLPIGNTWQFNNLIENSSVKMSPSSVFLRAGMGLAYGR